MKRLVSSLVFTGCMLAVPAVAGAQDCSNWRDFDIRGTYTMSGSGFIDLAKVLPGAGLPSGMVPIFWVGAIAYDGTGGGRGWVSFNAAGTQMNAQLAGIAYSVKTDCSVQLSFSMKVKELGVTIGPARRLMVIVAKPGGLELHMIFAGSAPGAAPDPAIDLGVAHRISLQF